MSSPNPGPPPDVVDFEHQCGAESQRRERSVAQIAGKQWGVISRAQMERLGFTRRAIARRLQSGRLHELHRGVYAVGHRRLSIRGHWLAAVLACGDSACLSHRPAASLHELRPIPSGPVDVTVECNGRRRQSRLRVHKTARFHPDDRAFRHGIPVTSLARTLLDLAEVVPANQLRRALQQAQRLEIFDLGAMSKLCERSRGRHGLKPLRAALLEFTGPPPITRSEFEEMFVDFAATFEIKPRPVMNAIVLGEEVDALWREQRLIVELDSRSFHDNPAAFETDRARDMLLQVAGYRVLRITYRRLVERPEEVADAIRALLRGPRA